MIFIHWPSAGSEGAAVCCRGNWLRQILNKCPRSLQTKLLLRINKMGCIQQGTPRLLHTPFIQHTVTLLLELETNLRKVWSFTAQTRSLLRVQTSRRIILQLYNIPSHCYARIVQLVTDWWLAASPAGGHWEGQEAGFLSSFRWA